MHLHARGKPSTWFPRGWHVETEQPILLAGSLDYARRPLIDDRQVHPEIALRFRKRERADNYRPERLPEP